MTTISNKRRRKNVSLSLIIFLVLLALAIGAMLLWRDAVAGVLWRALAPVSGLREQAAVASSDFFAQFTANEVLVADNKRLREQLASTTALILDRTFLAQENRQLKAMLGRNETTHVVVAAVIMRPPGTPYDTLMLDAGKKQHIQEGDLVAAAGNTYIGRVASVYDSSSKVILFSAPGQNYQAMLRGTVPLALSGQGGGSITGELPIGTDVKVGDSVLLPSIEPTFLAIVTAVVHREGESFQSVFLSLPVNPLELRLVEVRTSAQ